MKKIKFLSRTGICYSLLFIFNAGIVFFGILYNQIWFLVCGILLSLFQCRLYSFHRIKSTSIQKFKRQQPAHIAVSFYHRPTGLPIKTFGEVYADGHKTAENTFPPGAN